GPDLLYDTSPHNKAQKRVGMRGGGHAGTPRNGATAPKRLICPHPRPAFLPGSFLVWPKIRPSWQFYHSTHCQNFQLCHIISLISQGADLASTWVTKQSRACRAPVSSLIHWKTTNANDERFALAA